MMPVFTGFSLGGPKGVRQVSKNLPYFSSDEQV